MKKSTPVSTTKALKGVKTSTSKNKDIDYLSFAEKAAEISTYYGFSLLKEADPLLAEENPAPIKASSKKSSAKSKPSEEIKIEGISPIMRAYIEQGMFAEPQPVKLYCNGLLKEEDGEMKPLPSPANEFALEVLGSTKSIADAMVIFISTIALREVGFGNIMVDINSLGDAESRKEYQKQLVIYYRKVSANLCSECKHHLRSKPLLLLECTKPTCLVQKEKAPQTIAHLSVESKQHFKEVLEFLDALNITYRINTNLIRGLDFYTHTVFELTEMRLEMNDDIQPILYCQGGRYDGLAKKLGSKKDVPAVGCTLHLDNIVTSPQYKAATTRTQKKAKIYFIQIGFEAKLKSLEVLEVLRIAKIPVIHALAKDSLTQQLATAEKSGVAHAIIFGQKEALDGTVIIRNLNTRSQNIVRIKDLSDFIKRGL